MNHEISDHTKIWSYMVYHHYYYEVTLKYYGECNYILKHTIAWYVISIYLGVLIKLHVMCT